MAENEPVSEMQRRTEPCAKWSAILILATVVTLVLSFLTHSALFLCVLFPAIIVSIILGIIGLFRICISHGKFRGSYWAFLGIVFHLIITAGIVIPALQQIPELAERIECGKRLASLGKAIDAYTSDHGSRYPDSNSWCDLLIADANVRLYNYMCKFDGGCRLGESSYAMNENLKGKKVSDVAADIVVLFETDYGNDKNGQITLYADRDGAEPNSFYSDRKVRKDKWNQHGGPELLTLEHHDGKGCMVLFADGHLEWIKAKDIKNLRWEVEEPND